MHSLNMFSDLVMNNNLLAQKIKHLADINGIDALGFAAAHEFTGYALGRSKRRDPSLPLPSAKTIIVAGVYIGGLTLPVWKDRRYGRTSRLYLSGFFSDVSKPLKPVADFLREEGYQAIVCDSATEESSILPLKLAAVRAGLGWQGKHSLLISKKYGTFLALGGIITDADIEPNDKVEPNRCRDCEICREACPMNAIDQPHVLSREKCLSHLLMEENLPEDVPAIMENRIGDCEICQEACPWNRKHLARPLDTKMTETFQQHIGEFETLFHLDYLAGLSEERYAEAFARFNTGIPYGIFRRNVLIALNMRGTTYSLPQG